jgi:SAM-dependent methyltransferase
MGIDLHNLNFLAHAQDLGVSYERTLAIGRQAMFVEPRALDTHRRRRGLPALQGDLSYFEPLVAQWYGGREVDAVDASPYEGAKLIHDMNLPWTDPTTRGRYDAVLDFGCLEHVFDFPTAWRNCVEVCRVGGHVLHALPANNLSGHGFYQFSPELFFNLYRPERGFALKAVYFALRADGEHWWRVANPIEIRRRVNLCNSHEVYLLVLAQKVREPGELAAPQQSDYAESEWIGESASAPQRGPSPWQQPLAALGVLDVARRMRERLRALRSAGLSLPAPDYERLVVAALLRR